MKPTQRRVLQAVLYELFAIGVVGPVLGWLFDEPMGSSLALAVVLSAMALTWNYVFNALFERWEARQVVRGRSLARRVAHGFGFEGGLALLLVPLVAHWLDMNYWHAFITDLGLLMFFLVYTMVFTWVFDRVFGLPASAQPIPTP